MANKAKHAFGALERIDEAISAGTINAYDILFVKDEKGKPYVGWLDKNGDKVIVDDSAELSALESQIATKVDADEVNDKINEASQNTVATAKAYTDGKIEAAINEHLVKKFKVSSLPVGSLVDYSEGEIRIMCPANSAWSKQNVGTGGNPNVYYATFRTYVTDDRVVGYREHMGGQSDAEILTDLRTDEYGRKFQTTWLGIAVYDEANDSWSYYGAKSNEDKYIGWDYQIDWYDVDGIMIASDSIRINLSNEECHFTSKPYYVSSIMKEVDTKINTKFAEVESAIEIIEF